MNKEVRAQLRALVDDLLAAQGGGESYFTALDAGLQQRQHLPIVKALFEDIEGGIVVTGQFGAYIRDLQKFYLLPPHPLVHFTGHLRTGDLPRVVYCGTRLPRALTFVDDSFYSGKTLHAIERVLQNAGHTITRVRVVYDGSPLMSEVISSLYRYYDHHVLVARALPVSRV